MQAEALLFLEQGWCSPFDHLCIPAVKQHFIPMHIMVMERFMIPQVMIRFRVMVKIKFEIVDMIVVMVLVVFMVIGIVMVMVVVMIIGNGSF